MPSCRRICVRVEAATVNPPDSVATRPDSRLRGRKRWRLIDSPQRGKLQHSGLPKLIAQVLENRGIATTADAQQQRAYNLLHNIQM